MGRTPSQTPNKPAPPPSPGWSQWLFSGKKKTPPTTDDRKPSPARRVDRLNFGTPAAATSMEQQPQQNGGSHYNGGNGTAMTTTQPAAAAAAPFDPQKYASPYYSRDHNNVLNGGSSDSRSRQSYGMDHRYDYAPSAARRGTNEMTIDEDAPAAHGSRVNGRRETYAGGKQVVRRRQTSTFQSARRTSAGQPSTARRATIAGEVSRLRSERLLRAKKGRRSFMPAAKQANQNLPPSQRIGLSLSDSVRALNASGEMSLVPVQPTPHHTKGPSLSVFRRRFLPSDYEEPAELGKRDRGVEPASSTKRRRTGERGAARVRFRDNVDQDDDDDDDHPQDYAQQHGALSQTRPHESDQDDDDDDDDNMGGGGASTTTSARVVVPPLPPPRRSFSAHDTFVVAEPESDSEMETEDGPTPYADQYAVAPITGTGRPEDARRAVLTEATKEQDSSELDARRARESLKEKVVFELDDGTDTTPSVQAPPTGGALGWGGLFDDQKNKWRCSTCGLLNEEKSPNCSACDSGRVLTDEEIKRGIVLPAAPAATATVPEGNAGNSAAPAAASTTGGSIGAGWFSFSASPAPAATGGSIGAGGISFGASPAPAAAGGSIGAGGISFGASPAPAAAGGSIGPGGFSLGGASAPASSTTPAPGFSLGTTTAASAAATTTAPVSSSGGISSAGFSIGTTTTAAPTSSSGGTSSAAISLVTTTAATNTTTAPASSSGATSSAGFSIGTTSATATASPAAGITFGAAAPTSTNPQPTAGVSFGTSTTVATPAATTTNTPAPAAPSLAASIAAPASTALTSAFPPGNSSAPSAAENGGQRKKKKRSNGSDSNGASQASAVAGTGGVSVNSSQMPNLLPSGFGAVPATAPAASAQTFSFGGAASTGETPAAALAATGFPANPAAPANPLTPVPGLGSSNNASAQNPTSTSSSNAPAFVFGARTNNGAAAPSDAQLFNNGSAPASQPAPAVAAPSGTSNPFGATGNTPAPQTGRQPFVFGAQQAPAPAASSAGSIPFTAAAPPATAAPMPAANFGATFGSVAPVPAPATNFGSSFGGPAPSSGPQAPSFGGLGNPAPNGAAGVGSFGQPAPAAAPFGQPAPAFGQPGAAFGGFGNAPAPTGFAAPAGGFGAPQGQPGGFGAPQAPQPVSFGAGAAAPAAGGFQMGQAPRGRRKIRARRPERK